jgi:hypothetical protein
MSSEEIRRIQNAIIDPDPFVEDVLRKVDARVNQTIVGIDGTPLLVPIVDDRTITYAKDGESISLDPEDFWMRAARMHRDGMSLKQIRVELDLISSGPQEVTLNMLGRAIQNWGMPMLLAAIAEGREPEESVRVIGYEDPADDDEVEVAPEVWAARTAHRRSEEDARGH